VLIDSGLRGAIVLGQLVGRMGDRPCTSVRSGSGSGTSTVFQNGHAPPANGRSARRSGDSSNVWRIA
jgi:hypothetical protein